MLWVLDRFDEEYAVLIYGENTVYIKRSHLPDGSREGSVIQFREDGPILCIDEERIRRQRNRARLQNLFSRSR